MHASRIEGSRVSRSTRTDFSFQMYLDLLLMAPNRYVSSFEVLQATGMIEMQMAHDDGLDIFYIVAGFLDLSRELVIGSVIDSGLERRRPPVSLLSGSALRRGAQL